MKTVLFVCVENSCRSQMAEAFANMFGQDIIKAYSSGSKPSGIVNPKAIATMKEVNYDLSAHRSKSLDEIPQIEYGAVITMGCGDYCPTVKARSREDWQIPDPKHMEPEEFAKVRETIRDQVSALIKNISGE